MLTRLRALFGLSRRPRRAIFRFRVGGRWEYRDPAVVRQKLNSADPNWGLLVDRVKDGAKPLPATLDATPALLARRRAAVSEAAGKLAELVLAGFDVSPVQPDGSGLTEAERLTLLADFLHFTFDLMEATRPLANGPAGTDSPAAR